MENSWKETNWIKAQRFITKSKDELIYVLQAGFEDTFIVVFENAYGDNIGETLVGNRKMVEDTFNIKL